MACFTTGAPLTSLSVQSSFFCTNRGRLNCLDLITRDWYTKNAQLCKNANGAVFKAWTNEEYRDTFVHSTYVSNLYLSTNSATDVVKVYLHYADCFRDPKLGSSNGVRYTKIPNLEKLAS